MKKAIDKSLKSKVKKSEVVNIKTINIVPVSKTNLMFELKSLRRRLSGVIIGGIPSITRALISKKDDEHVIYAEGLGLKKVLSLPGVHMKRSSSNHIT